MVLGIVSSGRGNRNSFSRRAGLSAVHIAGGVVGGVATAFCVWLALTPVRTLLPGPAVAAVLAGVVVAAVITDLHLFGRRSRRGRQVPQRWIDYGLYRGFALYGAVLGSGLLTYVPVALIYVTWAAIGLFLDLPFALLAGALLGFGRAFAVVLASFAPLRSRDFLMRSAPVQRALPWASVLASVLVLAGSVGQVVAG